MNENSLNDAVTMRPGASEVVGAIDQYELKRELGGGGFGCVYLARDTVAGIDVAVKGLPPLVRLNKEELENIRRNFALVSRLHHPNIAAALTLHPVAKAVYANRADAEKLRVFEDDTLVVMQYAPGVTLSQWRKQFPDSKVPLDKALEITRQIASALDYAHKEKILHRDIKSANVMIETLSDGSVTARVLDFGLAAEIRSSMSRVSQSITDTSGTRPYMAPEQWLGEEQGKETDQYALAVLFNELVTGKVPFVSVFDTGDPVLMMNVVGNRAFNPPSDLPKTIRFALTKALSKKREDRFESCIGFVDALVGRGVLTAPSGKAFGKIAAVGLLALGLAGGVWYWQDAKAKEEARIVAEQKAEAERKATERAKAEAEERARKDEEARNIQESGVSGQGLGKESREDEPKAQTDRQKEVAELDRLSTLITIKIDDATIRMEKVKSYRGETDGFISHLAAIDEKWRIIETAERKPTTTSEAKTTLEKLNEADSVIAQELEWLKTNKSARDGANAIEREIAGSLESELNRFNASDYARSTYNDGIRHRKEGNGALEAGDFPTAHKKLTVAKEKLTVAIKEAKAFCIKTHLDSAELYLSSKKWQMCVDKADKVLEWDANNAKAIDLKNAALHHLVPSLKVIATIDGEEVRGAKLNDGEKDHVLPTTLKFERGKNYGPYLVVYECGGKSYEGTFDAMTADWHGLKLQRVALKEEAQDKVQLWKGGPYWAKKNIGAEKPEDYGYYFWWGDTVGYKREGDKWVASDGSNSNFEFRDLNTPTYKKSYNDLRSEGWITADEVLSPQHDAAQKHWGGKWRMPTNMELDDLVNKCHWRWTQVNGVNGYVVRGKGEYFSKSIFLPCAGLGDGTSLNYAGSYGYYWSSVPSSFNYDLSWYLYFNSGYHGTDRIRRYFGRSVRPLQGFTK